MRRGWCGGDEDEITKICLAIWYILEAIQKALRFMVWLFVFTKDKLQEKRKTME
jgi:hypothetical protein